MALARAIVRRSKLSILDEGDSLDRTISLVRVSCSRNLPIATSAIGYETDAVTQNSLRTNLGSDVTLFMIAHRLQIIMDEDKIVGDTYIVISLASR